MMFRISLPLALLALAAPAFGQAANSGKTNVQRATAVHPATPAPAATPAPSAASDSDKPLTEADLMKKLDEFRVGDPIKAQPFGGRAEPITEPGLPTLKPPGSAAPQGKPDANAKPPAKPGDPNAEGQDQTEITALEATFDSKTHQAVFLKNVVVVNPQFTVTCDKLTAFMRNNDNAAAPGAPGTPGAAAKPGAAATPAAAPSGASKAGGPAAAAKTGKKGGTAPGPNGSAAADPNAQNKTAGGLERAIAEGNVVITQDKTDENGNVTHSIGHGRKAVYEADTGDITLTGHPDVAQGVNTLEATEDSTVIILNREGRMQANGPHKSIIRDAGSDPNNPLAGGGSGKAKNSSTSPATATSNAR